MTIGKQMIGLMLATLIAWPFCACCFAESAEEAPAQCCRGLVAEPSDQSPETPYPLENPCAHCDGETEGLTKTAPSTSSKASGQVAPPPSVIDVSIQPRVVVDAPESGPDPPPPARQLLGALLCVFRL